MEKQTKRVKVAPMTRAGTPSRVLFVDDSADQLEFYEILFRGDCEMLSAPSALHALQVLMQEHTLDRPIRLVVSDYSMPGMTGVDFLDLVARQYPDMGRILLTGHADSEIVLEARYHKILTKSMDSRLIRNAVLRELRRHGG